MDSVPNEIGFSQLTSLGDVRLSLRRDRVVIFTTFNGGVNERHVQLTDIAQPIQMTDQRFLGETIFLIVFSIIFAFVSWNVAGPTWTSDILQILFGELALLCLCSIYVTNRRIPIARVSNKQGELLFEMYRRPNVALSYEEFLLHLQRRIKALNEP